jgi:hypothetical protein
VTRLLFLILSVVEVPGPHDLIAAAYGEGKAALFLDDSGYVFYSMPLPMNTIRNWIDGRLLAPFLSVFLGLIFVRVLVRSDQLITGDQGLRQ